MTEPLSLETILNELSDEDETWVLQNQQSGRYLTNPDDRFPGRLPIRFFLSRQDAESVLQQVLKVKSFQHAHIATVKVKTKQAIAWIARDNTPVPSCRAPQIAANFAQASKRRLWFIT